jgi:hypothetical protein
MTDTGDEAVRAVRVRRFTDRWPTVRHAPCVRWRLARSVAHARGKRTDDDASATSQVVLSPQVTMDPVAG